MDFLLTNVLWMTINCNISSICYFKFIKHRVNLIQLIYITARNAVCKLCLKPYPKHINYGLCPCVFQISLYNGLLSVHSAQSAMCSWYIGPCVLIIHRLMCSSYLAQLCT